MTLGRHYILKVSKYKRLFHKFALYTKRGRYLSDQKLNTNRKNSEILSWHILAIKEINYVQFAGNAECLPKLKGLLTMNMITFLIKLNMGKTLEMWKKDSDCQMFSRIVKEIFLFKFFNKLPRIGIKEDKNLSKFLVLIN